jgi:hypothetical protein
MQKIGSTKEFDEIAARLELLKGRAVHQPVCLQCKDKKMVPGDPAHPERGLKRCEACKPVPVSSSPVAQPAFSLLANLQGAQGGNQ